MSLRLPPSTPSACYVFYFYLISMEDGIWIRYKLLARRIPPDNTYPSDILTYDQMWGKAGGEWERRILCSHPDDKLSFLLYTPERGRNRVDVQGCGSTGWFEDNRLIPNMGLMIMRSGLSKNLQRPSSSFLLFFFFFCRLGMLGWIIGTWRPTSSHEVLDFALPLLAGWWSSYFEYSCRCMYCTYSRYLLPTPTYAILFSYDLVCPPFFLSLPFSSILLFYFLWLQLYSFLFRSHFYDLSLLSTIRFTLL